MLGLYTTFTFPQHGVRYIAITDNFDTIDQTSVSNDFAGIKNWFNEFYARDTSRKIRAVNRARGEKRIPLTTNVPYGYVKGSADPKKWIIDPEAAAIVKRIFQMCMEGRGPHQIANQLTADKILYPAAYKYQHGIRAQGVIPENPYHWNSANIADLLKMREYTGCLINFKTYSTSIWDKKRHTSEEGKQAIFLNHHEAIMRKMCFSGCRRFGNKDIGLPRAGKAASFRAWCTAQIAGRRCIILPQGRISEIRKCLNGPPTIKTETSVEAITFETKY